MSIISINLEEKKSKGGVLRWSSYRKPSQEWEEWSLSSQQRAQPSTQTLPDQGRGEG